jgi:hypothetical protein
VTIFISFNLQYVLLLEEVKTQIEKLFIYGLGLQIKDGFGKSGDLGKYSIGLT